jgi:hypothetical protein
MNRLIFLLLMFYHGSGMAEKVVSINSIEESYSQNVKVSGEFLVGMQLNNSDNSKSLHVIFPKGSTGELIIELSSIDGKYKAELRHDIIDPISDFTKINFASEYQEIFNNYESQEIAISATLKKSGKDTRLMSSWGSNMSDELILLIRSSARKDVAYVPSKENHILKAKCKKFRKSYNVSYDKYCILKGIDLEKIKSIEIVRKNLQPIEPETIVIN